MTLTALCPAKINLFLAVSEPDPSGYHPIQTIFQTISLYDRLAVSTETVSTKITSDWQELPHVNTLSRALSLYGELVMLPHVHIHLEKSIPIQSGLGGGSSDAAGLLRILQKICPTPVTEEHLFEIASAVGADVPFFLVGGTAVGTGYGNMIEMCEDADEKWLVIAQPECGVSTATAYARLDSVMRNAPKMPISDYWSNTYNDFERVAPTESLKLLEFLSGAGAGPVGLCGSGSAVYGVFGSETGANIVAQKLKHRAWVAKTLSRQEIPWIS